MRFDAGPDTLGLLHTHQHVLIISPTPLALMIRNEWYEAQEEKDFCKENSNKAVVEMMVLA